MELCVFTEPQQGASYDRLLAVAQAAESLGFTGFFRSDHYLVMGDFDGLPGPTDAWVTLAGLARETSRIRLGTLVTPVTFRLPGVLAIQVAQVDQMSGGRVELGLGAGWYEAEHLAYGIPFPGTSERFDHLEEQVAVVTGLLSTPPGDTFSYAGKHYTFTDSPALPKPAQERVPLIIGGGGKRRTPELAARYATEFNIGFVPVTQARERSARVDEACRAIGRDPATLSRSAALVVCAGRTEAEIAKRASFMKRDVAELRESGLAGTPGEIVDRARHYAEAGIGRIYLQLWDLDDLDHLDLIASEVMPQLA